MSVAGVAEATVAVTFATGESSTTFSSSASSAVGAVVGVADAVTTGVRRARLSAEGLGSVNVGDARDETGEEA
jgi:hypothetical protein